MAKVKKFTLNQKHIDYFNRVVPELVNAEETVAKIKGSKEWKRAYDYFSLCKHRGLLKTRPTKENGYTVEDKEYDKVLKNLKKVSSVSIFTRLVNKTSLTAGVEQDLDGDFVKYSTALKQKNIVVELIYDRQQDVIVECDGHTKVVSYYCLSYVIPVTEKFSDVVVYYATTNGDGKDNSYAACQPFVLKGEAGNFMDFVKSL